MIPYYMAGGVAGTGHRNTWAGRMSRLMDYFEIHYFGNRVKYLIESSLWSH